MYTAADPRRGIQDCFGELCDVVTASWPAIYGGNLGLLDRQDVRVGTCRVACRLRWSNMQSTMSEIISQIVVGGGCMVMVVLAVPGREV